VPKKTIVLLVFMGSSEVLRKEGSRRVVAPSPETRLLHGEGTAVKWRRRDTGRRIATPLAPARER
jgi:hypothetical protein